MKKSGYLLVGILAGVIAATATGALAESAKSLVGQKVAGEYSVKVNGQMLSEKGAAIDGKTMVPLRAVSNALNAQIKVDNKAKVVEVQTAQAEQGTPTAPIPMYPVPEGNPYLGLSKTMLNDVMQSTKENRLKPLEDDRAKLVVEIAQANSDGNEARVVEKQKQLDETERLIAGVNETITQVEEALASAK